MSKQKKKKTEERALYKPQPGKQTEFLASPADVAIYGGSAGSGKTYGLLLDPLRFFHLDNVNAVILRRTKTQLGLPGSIWAESQKIYGSLGCKPNLTKMQYKFAKNSYLKFAGIQYESDVNNFQGSVMDFLGFDELTHFSEEQFWYLLSRVRSSGAKMKPYVRATCNPENCWVFHLLSWWLDQNTGYPIPERAGKLRWLLRLGNANYWFSNKLAAEQYIQSHDIDERHEPLSFTFIPATINDNQILIKNDPSYYARLSQLKESEKIKLLYGCWLFKPEGKLFKAEWFQTFVIPPREIKVKLITCDTASSTKTANDYTVFQVWGVAEGKIYLLKQVRGRFTATEQLNLLINLIMTEKCRYASIERASTGFHLIDEIRKQTGVIVYEMVRNKDKYQRAYDEQEYVERGYVYLDANGDYYADFIGEVTGFSPENKNNTSIHDDQVDCLIDAIYLLLDQKIWYDANIELTPRYSRSPGYDALKTSRRQTYSS